VSNPCCPGAPLLAYCDECGKKMDMSAQVTALTAERDEWRRKWEDLETSRAMCCLKMEEALRLIAAPPRPDGTYNLSREACEQIAREALAPKESPK
jgi:hypothetical protein